MSIEDLIEFFRARLAEDEQQAVRAGGREWEIGPAFGARENMVRVREEGNLLDSVGSCAETWAFVGQTCSVPNWRENAQHITRHNPARALRDVEAKRRLIHRYQNAVAAPTSVVSFTRGQDNGYMQACLDAIRDAAEAYADHPDYRQEWRP